MCLWIPFEELQQDCFYNFSFSDYEASSDILGYGGPKVCCSVSFICCGRRGDFCGTFSDLSPGKRFFLQETHGNQQFPQGVLSGRMVMGGCVTTWTSSESQVVGNNYLFGKSENPFWPLQGELWNPGAGCWVFLTHFGVIMKDKCGAIYTFDMEKSLKKGTDTPNLTDSAADVIDLCQSRQVQSANWTSGCHLSRPNNPMSSGFPSQFKCKEMWDRGAFSR